MTRSAPSRRACALASAAALAAATLTGGALAATPATATPSAGQGRPAQHRSPIAVHRSPLTAGQVARLQRHADQHVIVLLRDQATGTLGSSRAAALDRRTAAVDRAASGVVADLQRLHAPHLHRYNFLGAVSAEVSAAEAGRLRRDPDVRAVVPDRMIALPAGGPAGTGGTGTGTTRAPATRHASGAPDPVNTTPGICGTAEHPLLEPEALSRIDAVDPGHGITGAGVKVAIFADGVDRDLPDFVAPSGRHVVFDYRDFTGSGPDAVTDGEEAFGDVSAIAAQGRETYDLSEVTDPQLPLPAGCDIRVRGVAPGAGIAAMKVFGPDGAAESTILAGLDWAVTRDHVDVLSESFGQNMAPTSGQDPIALFDAEAVRDGITVVASSGDAGPSNTIGSPAADSPGVLAVGATTTFRNHAQLSQHGYQLGHDRGWEDDNIATLSSSGFTSYGPHSVDLVAPGDTGWADCSTDTATYTGCANPFGAGAGAPPVLDFGGTSQAAPLTAGVAALVIQGYRSTHDATDPSPAVVDRILTSSASDLQAPTQEQGAGLVDAQAAVALARAWTGSTVASTGSHLAVAGGPISATGAPGEARTARVGVAQQGTVPVTLHPRLEQFGAPRTVSSGTIDYRPSDPSTPTFTYWLDGSQQPYAEQDFTVPTGYQRLQARIGYPAPLNDPDDVAMVLFDPRGRLAQDTDPQGPGSGTGFADVRDPEPGTWRAVVFGRPADGGYSGPVSFSASVQRLVTVPGGVLPAVTVQPHRSATVTVPYHLPAHPGDVALGLYLGDGTGVVPVLTRATVPVTGRTPGTFTGRLSGGNGRPVLGSESKDYQFRVPAGLKDVDVDVRVGKAAFDTVASLVAPDGQVVDSQTTDFTDLTSPFGGATTNEPDVHLSWASPTAGLWELDLLTLGGDKSGLTSVPFTGTIAFDTVRVRSTDLPDSRTTVIRTGQPLIAHVQVTNTGDAPELYYIDPRRSGQTTYQMSFVTPPSGTVGSDKAEIIVPPDTTSAVVSASAARPVQFATSPVLGSPTQLSTSGKEAVVGLSDHPQASEWSCGPAFAGVFTKAVPTTAYTCAGLANTATINDGISATGGNLWDLATDPRSPNSFFPLESTIVQPGRTTTLAVAIDPSDDDILNVVHGYLEVQTFNPITFASDVLARVPYRYLVKYGS